MKKLVLVVGTTASGKSSWALSEAIACGGAIVNCDSLQVYEDLNIGTAKPSDQDFSSCPHHLFNIRKTGEHYTAGEFRKDALETIQQNIKNSHLYVVGGTGFYLRALLKGMYDVEVVPQEITDQLKEEIKNLGLEKLFSELQKWDPEYAESISANDSYRVLRALSIIRSGQGTPSQIKIEHEKRKNNFNFPYVKVGFTYEKEELLNRVTLRAEKMISGGLVEEVRALIKKVDASWAPMMSVGYRETQMHIRGELNLDELKEEIIKNTMRLAKRQRTWFKKDEEVHWFPGGSEKEASKFVKEFLES